MKDKIKLIYRILIVIVSAIGLYLNFKFLTFEKGILYFTNLSNLFCMIYFLILVILMLMNKVKKNEKYYIFKGMVTMAITFTMLIYNLVLTTNDGVQVFANHQFECSIVHILVPLMVIFDYIIFDEKGYLKREYPIIWSFVLIVYQIFIFIYVALGGTFIDGLLYPYFFMDIEKNGTMGVVFNSLVVYILFIGCGNILQILDNKLGRKYKNKKEKVNYKQ